MPEHMPVITFGDPVITPGAFVCGSLLNIKVPCAIRATLNTISTTYAILIIHQHNTIFCLKRCPYRTNLYAWGIITMIAYFWYIECFINFFRRYVVHESIYSTVW